MSKYFGPVYWIGLGRRSDRQWTFDHNAKILTELHPIYKFEAMDGTRLRLMDDPLADSESYLRGAIGCYLSHLSVLQHIAANKVDALVLEDDALLKDNFNQLIDEKLLGLIGWEHIMLADDNETGTWAYIIQWEAAEKLVGLLQDRIYPIDEALIRLAESGAIASRRITDTVTHLKDELGSNIATDGQVHIRPHLSCDTKGEDLVIEAFFDGKKNLRFMDVGCSNAGHSVTRRLLMDGWRGLYIEPDPYQWVRLHQCNERIGGNEFICAALAPNREVRSLIINRDLGKSTTDPNRHERQKHKFLYWGCCRTPTVTPSEITQMFGNDFAFINLNCSGLEEHVIKSSGAMLLQCSLLRTTNQPEVIAAARAFGFENVIMTTDSHIMISR